MAFKIGDRVVCVNDCNFEDRLTRGKEYTISRVSGEFVQVKELVSVWVAPYLANRFELVKGPKLDLSKPVQTRNGDAVRILCTDAPGETPVIGMIGTTINRYTLDGRWHINAHAGHEWNLVNVPPKPRSASTYVFLCARKDTGEVWVRKCNSKDHKFGPDIKVLAVKEVTITEGEGL